MIRTKTAIQKVFSKRFIKKHYLLLLILLLAGFLRFYRYPNFPVVGESEDERAWTMIGASLIQEGKPSSWSYFEVYEEKGLREWHGKDPIVSPALDHPPLFALIPGAFHSLKAKWSVYPSIKLIRFPILLMGVFNVFLLYLVTQTLFKKKTISLLAALIYATAPIFVFSSRLVMAENFLVTLMLILIYLLKQNNWAKKQLLILIIICSLAIFSKVSGITLALGTIFYALLIKNRQVLIAGIMGLIFGIFLFAVYGAFYDWSIFFKIFTSQAGRKLGLATLHNRFFLHPTVVAKIFFDGWPILGLISTLALFFQDDKNFLIIKSFFLVNLFFILATVGEQSFNGWYDIVFHPLFAISIAWLFVDCFYKKNYLFISIMAVLLLPVIRMALVQTWAYFDLSNLALRILMGFCLLPLVLSLILPKKKKLAQYAVLFLALFFLVNNIISVLTINDRSYGETDKFFGVY
ncbi:MAG: glycosyltransferase family 39 protein [Candidatus Woesebacteria bacterium]|jgi:4-amino-4-deoxy-L-arabinose transferase-like glycosyltransferase